MAVIGFYNIFSYGYYVDSVKAVGGKLNLYGIELDDKTIVPLQGEWKFFNRQFISPKGVSNINDIGEYEEIPPKWSIKDGAGSFFKGNEYGTFILNVKTQNKGVLRAIRIPSIYSAYKLWIDDDLVATNGIVSDNLEGELVKVCPVTKSFVQKKDEFTIILQVSNFNHVRRMFLENIEIGSNNALTQKNKFRVAEELFLVGIFFMVAMYNFNLYFFNRKSKKYLHFAVFNMLVLMRILIVKEKLLVQLMPGADWEILVKWEYILLCFSVVSMFRYFKSIYYSEMSEGITKGVDLISYIYIIIISVSKMRVYSRLMTIYQVFMIITLIYIIKVLIGLVIKKDENSFYIALGTLLFSCTIINDILCYNRIIKTEQLVYLGFFIFITIEAIVISIEYSRTLAKLKDAVNEAFISSNNLGWEKYNRKLAEKLREVTTILNSTLDLKEVLKRLLENLKSIVPYDSACVMLEQREQLHVMAVCNVQGCTLMDDQTIIEKDNRIINTIIKEKRPLILNDIEISRSDCKSIFPNMTNNNSGSFMAIPLIAYGVFLGILVLEHNEKNLYQTTEVDVALTFAAQASTAIQNAKLFGNINHLAQTDSLTGIGNRRNFLEISNREFLRAREENSKLSFVMLDIDCFKNINDTYGHIIGDEVLVNVANICKKCIRINDIIGRYGGEEFGIILPGLGIGDVFNIAENIRQLVEGSIIDEEGCKLKATVSMGIQELKHYHNTFKDMIEEADKALYKAKSMGKNRIEFYK